MTSNFVQFDGDEIQPLPTEQRQTPARRATDTNLEIIAHKTARLAGEFSEFKQERRDDIKEIKASIKWTHATLHEATTRAKEAADNAEASVKKSVQEAMASAFPDGDPDGHKRHHEAVIKAAEERAELLAKLKLELIKWGLFGFLGWALYLLWQGFLLGPKK